MLKYKRRIHCYTSNWVRRCLAVAAFAAMSLAISTFANTPITHHGSMSHSLKRTATPVGIRAAKSIRPTGASVYVANVEELYLAVNDPANAGAIIEMAPGLYILSAIGPSGSPRPNGGRLELQQDMSLIGVADDRSAVVIDLLYGNQNTDFEAFGARSTAGISGTNNTVTIELFGVSKRVDVVTTDSMPFEAAGTNAVTVVR